MQFGTDFLEIRAHVITVSGVVHHDEQDGFLPKRLMLGVALAPLFDAEFEVVVIFFREDRTGSVAQFRAAGGIGQDRMLDDVLMDGLEERIVGNGLDEDRAVVMAWRSGHVHLEPKTAIFLQHSMVDVLDGFKPRHPRVVDVMRLVVENGQLLNFSHDLAEVGLAIGGFAGGLRAERIEEIVAQVFVLQRGVGNVAEEDAVNVGEEEVSGVAYDAHVVLDMECELEVVAPVPALMPIVGQDRIVEENFEAVEVGPQAVENDDVGRDDEEVPRKLRAGFVDLVKEAPRDEERKNFGFSGAGCQFQHVTRPILVEHAAGDGP